MAVTNLLEYSAQQKLNKMDIDIINVTPLLDGSEYATGDLLFNQIKIENAVAVPGGRSILQSVCAINANAVIGNFDLVFTSEGDDAIGSLNGVLADQSGISDANALYTLGKVSMTGMFDIGASSIGSKHNIGMVLKAQEGSKDVFVWGVSKSVATYTTTGLTLRIGILKD